MAKWIKYPKKVNRGLTAKGRLYWPAKDGETSLIDPDFALDRVRLPVYVYDAIRKSQAFYHPEVIGQKSPLDIYDTAHKQSKRLCTLLSEYITNICQPGISSLSLSFFSLDFFLSSLGLNTDFVLKTPNWVFVTTVLLSIKRQVILEKLIKNEITASTAELILGADDIRYNKAALSRSAMANDGDSQGTSFEYKDFATNKTGDLPSGSKDKRQASKQDKGKDKTPNVA